VKNAKDRRLIACVTGNHTVGHNGHSPQFNAVTSIKVGVMSTKLPSRLQFTTKVRVTSTKLRSRLQLSAVFVDMTRTFVDVTVTNCRRDGSFVDVTWTSVDVTAMNCRLWPLCATVHQFIVSQLSTVAWTRWPEYTIYNYTVFLSFLGELFELE